MTSSASPRRAPKGSTRTRSEQLGGRSCAKLIAGGHVVEHRRRPLQDRNGRGPRARGAHAAPGGAAAHGRRTRRPRRATSCRQLDEAVAEKDHEALNLLARHFLALHAKEKKDGPRWRKPGRRRRRCWPSAAARGPRRKRRSSAPSSWRPRFEEELGQTWLDQSFTKQPERGMDILATIGGRVAQGMQHQPDGTRRPPQGAAAAEDRRRGPARAAPERATKWRATLALLAGNWLKEAEFSHQFDHSDELRPTHAPRPLRQLLLHRRRARCSP